MKPKQGKNQRVEGIVKRHPDGFGFLIPDAPDQPDVYIPRREMNGVMANDRVSVVVNKENKGQRTRAAKVLIRERSTKTVTGQFFALSKTKGMLRDSAYNWGADLIVERPKEFAVRDRDWVSVEVLTYPGSESGFTGRITSVIGDIEDPLNDARRILLTHQIPTEFSQAVDKELEGVPNEITDKEWSTRWDMTDFHFITIDGQTAQDFDDAIYVKETESGFKVIVAIADVSHYVKPGSILDHEAYQRGTSTYFPNFVNPMLPEKLSNNICSLNPGVPRLAVVCDMLVSFEGEVLASDFYEAVIQSHARVTYGQAQEVIDGNTPEEFAHIESIIKKGADVAKILMAKRFSEGSLDLDIPETEVEVDDTGNPLDIIKAERLFSHHLIEELMLIANVTVARFFSDNEVSVLYRVHAAPEQEAIETLSSFLEAFGYQKKLSGGKLQKKVSRALEAFAGQTQQHILNILTLRSMSQAQYSAYNIGHFGLGFDDYVHFTSPIRRYPDLIVHRLLKVHALRHPAYEVMEEGQLEEAGTFLSACEQRSVKAERHLHAVKKARFMSAHIGEEFDGIISSVTKFGVFVLLRRFEVDGLVKLEELGQEEFEFDEKNLRLVAKRSGLTYTIGDRLKVQVARTDIQEGKIDFILGGDASSAPSKPKKKKSTKKRRKTKNNRRRSRQVRISKSRRKS